MKIKPHLHRWDVFYDDRWIVNPVRRCVHCHKIEVWAGGGRWIKASLRHKLGGKVWLITTTRDRFRERVAYLQSQQAFNVEHIEFLPLLTEQEWEGLMEYVSQGHRPRFVFDPADWYDNDYIKRPEFATFLGSTLDLL